MGEYTRLESELEPLGQKVWAVIVRKMVADNSFKELWDKGWRQIGWKLAGEIYITELSDIGKRGERGDKYFGHEWRQRRGERRLNNTCIRELTRLIYLFQNYNVVKSKAAIAGEETGTGKWGKISRLSRINRWLWWEERHLSTSKAESFDECWARWCGVEAWGCGGMERSGGVGDERGRCCLTYILLHLRKRKWGLAAAKGKTSCNVLAWSIIWRNLVWFIHTWKDRVWKTDPLGIRQRRTVRSNSALPHLQSVP